jgi:predicted RNA polymerase sigma factor
MGLGERMNSREGDAEASSTAEVFATSLTDWPRNGCRLALMFACAHPAIDVGVRAPLMLQVVVGLDAKVIAPAFLISTASILKIQDARLALDAFWRVGRCPSPILLQAAFDAK